MQQYIMISLEDAKKIAKKDAIVLVAISDLETNYNDEFNRRTFGECKNLMEEAQTIAKACDEFVSQLRLFSEKQTDAVNFERKGKLSTILLKVD